MSFKHLDVDSALARIADRKIEEVMREGKFDNLAGAGMPLELEPIPTDERARMLWWALKLLKQNDIVPEEVAWRKEIDELKEKLAAADRESQIVSLVMKINRIVRQINTMGTNAIASPVTQVSLDEEMERFRLAHQSVPMAAIAPRPIKDQKTQAPMVSLRNCVNAACRSRNQASARYCRRCGSPMLGKALA